MEKEIKEFMERKDERRSSANAKLKLLIYGVQDNAENFHNFEKVCPGKEKYVGFDHVIESLLYLKNIYGTGKVWSNFVAGIVPIEDMKEGFKFMAEHGIVPGANIYHAEVGSCIGKSIGRIEENYVLELYRYASELYHRYDYKPFFDAGVLRNSLANEVYEGLL